MTYNYSKLLASISIGIFLLISSSVVIAQKVNAASCFSTSLYSDYDNLVNRQPIIQAVVNAVNYEEITNQADYSKLYQQFSLRDPQTKIYAVSMEITPEQIFPENKTLSYYNQNLLTNPELSRAYFYLFFDAADQNCQQNEIPTQIYQLIKNQTRYVFLVNAYQPLKIESVVELDSDQRVLNENSLANIGVKTESKVKKGMNFLEIVATKKASNPAYLYDFNDPGRMSEPDPKSNIPYIILAIFILLIFLAVIFRLFFNKYLNQLSRKLRKNN